MQRSSLYQLALLETKPEPERLGSLRFPQESDLALRVRAVRATTYAKIVVNTSLANHCVQEYIAAGERGYSAQAIRRAPIDLQ